MVFFFFEEFKEKKRKAVRKEMVFFFFEEFKEKKRKAVRKEMVFFFFEEFKEKLLEKKWCSSSLKNSKKSC